MLKYFWLTALTTLFLIACRPDKHHFRLSGKFDNLNKAEFYVYSENGGLPKLDTIKIENGKFKYETELHETDILTLQYPNFARTLLIAAPGQALELKGDANNLDAVDISGDKMNERFSKLRLDNLKKPNNDRLLAAAQFIRDHADQPEAIAAYEHYFGRQENPQPATALPLLELLWKKQSQFPPMIHLYHYMSPRLRSMPGQMLQNFSAKDLKGNVISKATLKGKPSVLFFWASWSVASLEYLSMLRHIADEANGRVNVVSICLDPSQERCRSTLDNYQVSVPTICDEQVFASPLVKDLYIQNIPGNLVIDGQGKILAKNLTLPEIQERLKQIGL